MRIIKEIDRLLKDRELPYPYDFFQIYPFSNEMINAYLPLFDLKGKRLLTLGSSSDQAINASLVGCDDITIFDICPLAQYYHFLKIASLLQLNREEFLNFLFKWKPNTSYNFSVYKQEEFNRIKDILKELDYDSYQVWEYIFKEFEPYRLHDLFRKDILGLKGIINGNEYLYDDENYEKARDRVQETDFKFVTGHIGIDDLEGTYDTIWLSNVVDYLNDARIRKAMKNVRESLNPGGKAMLEYYRYDDVSAKLLPGMEGYKRQIKRIPLPNRDGTESSRSVLVYQKTR